MRISVTFHHDVVFIPSPLMYKEGDASIIHDIKFEGMTLIGLLKKLKGACQFPSNDDEVSNVGEIEDITPYGPFDFVREDDVVILNRTINDSFLTKLCNGTFISDQTEIRECSEPTDKELLIDSDDEGVDIRDIAEGRCGGKKCKKGVQSPSNKGKGVQSPGKKGKGVQSPGKKGKGVQSTGKKGNATVVDESGPTSVDESGQTIVDESGVETSRASMKEVVEASIAAGTLKLSSVKRRSKSGRIANRAKAFKFGKDG
nr:hypothetical protein [Tanacetum cinerariifolium]